jgi:hypothetical protein
MIPEENLEFFWFFMNTFILITTGFNCMFFARIFEQFGRMIRLIGAVLSELVIFMLFFIFWILVFAWLTRIAGQDFDDEEFPNLGVNAISVLNTFRNSVGDLVPPGTSLWNSHVEKDLNNNPDKTIDLMTSLWNSYVSSNEKPLEMMANPRYMSD